MQISKVISTSTEPTFSSEDVKKLTDFFSILIRIDQRKKAEQKQNASITKLHKTKV